MPKIDSMFSAMETTEADLIGTKIAGAKKVEFGPHKMMLPKGAIPEYVRLSPFEEFSWKTIGHIVRRKVEVPEELAENLLKAHQKIRPEEYIAFVWMATTLAGLGSILLAVFGGYIFSTMGFVGGILNGILSGFVGIVIMVLVPVITYNVLMGAPSSTASTRGKLIDARIPYSMSFIAAMASANVNIDVIFKELSRQPLYGEIQREAEWITRDTELLGMDIITAIKAAANRTPSQSFQDFLQGVVTTATSGGDLKPYFISKASQYEQEMKLKMKGDMETLGMLAESYVTVVVAFPLFLVVILAIMALMGGSGSGDSTVTILWGVVGAMIPLSQFGFIFVVWNMSQEA